MCVTEFFPSAPGNLQVFEGRKKRGGRKENRSQGGKVMRWNVEGEYGSYGKVGNFL